MKASAKQEASAARKSGENEGANWIQLEHVFNRNQGGQKKDKKGLKIEDAKSAGFDEGRLVGKCLHAGTPGNEMK